MVAFPFAQRLKLPVAPLGGAVVALAFALLVTALPAAVLEEASVAIALPSVLPAAAPPLGATARLLLGAMGGAGIGLMTWGVLLGAFGARALYVPLQRTPRAAGAKPVAARKPADPPARAPLRAMRDLGTPFLDVRAEPEAPPAPRVVVPPVERPLPRDLNAPLAAFDPSAIPEAPLPPVRAVPSLARIATPEPEADPVPAPEPAEPVRIETFELTPHVRLAPESRAAVAAEPAASSSLMSLLERLEAGVARAVPQAERRRA